MRLMATEFASLRELRSGLAGRGVPSRDVPFHGPVVDVSQEMAYLRAAQAIAQDGRAAAAKVTVDSSARIIGPVILQEGVTVEAGATIIGPAILGNGARIGQGSVVAQRRSGGR